MSEKDDTEIIESSGNIYQDLGLPNAEIGHMKAKLAGEIIGILDRRKLTAVKASKLVGVDKSEISRIRNVELKRFTIDKLVKILSCLGRDVDVLITKKKAA